MKFITRCLMWALLLGVASGCTEQEEATAARQQVVVKAQRNPDSQFALRINSQVINELDILNRFAQELNTIDKNCKLHSPSGFRVRSVNDYNFFIFDLVDTLNRYPGFTDSQVVKFVDGHIYHFSPIGKNFATSSLAIYENRHLYFYRSVNCDVLKVKLNLAVEKQLEMCKVYNINAGPVIDNIKNYMSFNYWGIIDDDSFGGCNCE